MVLRPCLLLTLLLVAACTDDKGGGDRDDDTADGYDSDDTDSAGDTDTDTDDSGSNADCEGPVTKWGDPVVCALRDGIDGVRIREGTFRWLDMDMCKRLIAKVGTCYGNHPSSPYGMFDFDEDDHPDQVLASYQIEQHEALVYVGHTPPESRYFGFTNYQFDRLDGDGERLQTFGSLAPTLNFLEIGTAPGPTAPFDAYTAVIFAANFTTGERVRALLSPLLSDAGYDPEQVVNINRMAYVNHADAEALRAGGVYDPFSIIELTLGYDQQTDDNLMAMVRVAVPTDGTDSYFDVTAVPATVFKIAFDDAPAYDPFTYPVLPPDDWTGETQGQILRQQQEDVARQVAQQLAPPGTSTQTTTFDNTDQKSGLYCINDVPGAPGCGANNDDARYMRSDYRFRIPDVADPDSGLFVVGILHQNVAELAPIDVTQVTYSTLMIKDQDIGLGVTSVVDMELDGGYDHWLPDNVLGLNEAQRQSIYVHRFARDCQGQPFCTEIGDTFPGIEPEHDILFLERAYLNRTSLTAPHETSVFSPIVVAVGTNLRDGPGNKHLILN